MPDENTVPPQEEAPVEQPHDESAPEAALEQAVDEAIAEKPAQGAWVVLIDWAPDSTIEEREEAQTALLPVLKDIGSSPPDHLPRCVEGLTVKRVHD